MCIWQVPPTSLNHKWPQKTPARQTLYRTLSLHIYGGGKLYLDRHFKKKQEDLITFLKGKVVRHGSSECLPALN